MPERDDLRRALLAHFTGHLSISTTMRAHAGIGTAQAHHTISTAVVGIGVSFHDPVQWDCWIRYHHESTFAGAGMSYIRGQVLTEDGRLVMSFTQDAMIRALAPGRAACPSLLLPRPAVRRRAEPALAQALAGPESRRRR